MARPSQQLEAVLARFSTSHGASSDQAAQLRDAITSDAKLLAQFDQQAQSGQLKDFTLQASASTQPNLAGTYDKQGGVITLPAASLQSPGAVATGDLKATLQIQQMSVAFAHSTYQDAARNQHPVTQDMVDNLQSSINRSPYLADEIKKPQPLLIRPIRATPRELSLKALDSLGLAYLRVARTTAAARS